MNVNDFLKTHPNKSAANMDAVVACVKACYACAESCTMCADACLAEDQLENLRRCIRINLDCAAICTATGQVVARLTEPDTNLMRAQLQACVTACQVCAEECEKHAGRHGHCNLCAQSCRACEKACNDLLTAI